APGAGGRLCNCAALGARRARARSGNALRASAARAVRLALRPAAELQRPDTHGTPDLAAAYRGMAVRARRTPGMGQATIIHRWVARSSTAASSAEKSSRGLAFDAARHRA